MRLDTGDLHLGTKKQTIRIQNCAGRVSGSDLDESPGAEMVQHAEQHHCVRVWEIRIVEMIKQALGRPRLKRDSPIIGREQIQQIELTLVIEVDCGQTAGWLLF